MARRRLPGLQRVLGVNALFSTAFGNVGSTLETVLAERPCRVIIESSPGEESEAA